MTQIMAIACESPEQSGRPVDHWAHRELADEAKQRGIVPSISASQAGRCLAESDLQPHRSKYWLNTTEKGPDVFQTQVEVVCQAWRVPETPIHMEGSLGKTTSSPPVFRSGGLTTVNRGSSRW